MCAVYSSSVFQYEWDECLIIPPENLILLLENDNN